MLNRTLYISLAIISLCACAHRVVVLNPPIDPVSSIREKLIACLDKADDKDTLAACFYRADNDCINFDLEPECHEVPR
jgi:hypothetical protein